MTDLPKGAAILCQIDADEIPDGWRWEDTLIVIGRFDVLHAGVQDIELKLLRQTGDEDE